MKQDKEVWLRNEFVAGIAPLLQPVAHALLQAQEELAIIMQDFQESDLWSKPAGCASPGFHLLHIAGVLDRLITYAEGKTLTDQQLDYLNNETATPLKSPAHLLDQCARQIKTTLQRLGNFGEDTLTETRRVGRAGLPATVIGLCVHAAEHTMRHVGQLLVTVKILRS